MADASDSYSSITSDSRVTPSNQRWLGHWFNRVVTFLLVIVGWVFFRAADVHTGTLSFASVMPAIEMLGQMVAWRGLDKPSEVFLPGSNFWLMMAACWVWCNFVPNSAEVAYHLPLKKRYALVTGVILGLCFLNLGTPVDFLYFRF